MKKIFTYLLATAALMIISTAAMSQGGLTPFVGSTHVYTVTAEDDVNNTLAWTVTGGILNTDYTINLGAATEQVEITWLTAGTYTVSFTETADGTNCIASKQVSVVVGNNTFDVSTSNPGETCNAADGQVNYAGSTATTSITFTVDMTTANASFNPDWEIVFTLNPGSATLGSISADNGTLSGTGPYTLTDIGSTGGNGTVDITMDVTGNIYAIQNVLLTITSATELTYDTPDVDTNDWTATQTINPIPSTSTITTD